MTAAYKVRATKMRPWGRCYAVVGPDNKTVKWGKGMDSMVWFSREGAQDAIDRGLV